jgi:hypothetical protein
MVLWSKMQILFPPRQPPVISEPGGMGRNVKTNYRGLRTRPPISPPLGASPPSAAGLAKFCQNGSAANSTEHAPVRFFCSEEHAPVRFSTVAPFCCRTTPTSKVQHGPVRFYSDSSTAHVRFYRPTESTPPRALARQCRFTILYRSTAQRRCAGRQCL